MAGLGLGARARREARWQYDDYGNHVVQRIFHSSPQSPHRQPLLRQPPKLGVSDPAGFRHRYDANGLAEKLRYARRRDAGSAEAAVPPSSVTIASIASAASAASAAASAQTDTGAHLHLPDLDAKMQQEQSQQQRQATMISLGELRAADSPHRSRSMST